MLREVAGDLETEKQGDALVGAPEYAVQLATHRAALHIAELAELQRVLDAQGTRLPKEQFDASQAELLRYAATHGMLEVGALCLLLYQGENGKLLLAIEGMAAPCRCI